MKNIKACFSKETDNWKTPTELYNAFINKEYIDCFKYKDKENQYIKNYDQKSYL